MLYLYMIMSVVSHIKYEHKCFRRAHSIGVCYDCSVAYRIGSLVWFRYAFGINLCHSQRKRAKKPCAIFFYCCCCLLFVLWHAVNERHFMHFIHIGALLSFTVALLLSCRSISLSVMSHEWVCVYDVRSISSSIYPNDKIDAVFVKQKCTTHSHNHI